jgi:hypothetical protein
MCEVETHHQIEPVEKMWDMQTYFFMLKVVEM